MMTTLTSQDLLKKQSQLQARIQTLQVQEEAQKRKNATRKKILAGAYILGKHEREGTTANFLEEFDFFLIRKQDRELFGLPLTVRQGEVQ